MGLKVKLWGVRGSLPTATHPAVLSEHLQKLMYDFFDSGFNRKTEIEAYIKSQPRHKIGGFGGNTLCVEVSTNNSRIIIDGGSGLKSLGAELLVTEFGKGQGELHLLMTHFHWDHLIGIPFFAPIFIPGNIINIYSVQDGAEAALRTLFQKPYFPVPYEALGSNIKFHQLKPREKHKIGEIEFTPYELDHPDPCWGYKFEHRGRVFSHCVDTECTRVSAEAMGPDLPLYQNVDLMLFDAQYTLSEIVEKIDWGHAAAPIGIDVALREGIKKMIFMHHDPFALDEKIALAEKQTREYYNMRLKSGQDTGENIHAVDWLFAQEGMILDV